MTTQTEHLFRTRADDVHAVLKKHMLADGYPLVLDFERSHGTKFVDARTGDEYLDLFSFFASQPLGFNHPRLTSDDFMKKLGRVGTVKVTNSDVYTRAFADFVDVFGSIAVPKSHNERLFFIEGGALAVENAMKAAFDWKYRKNEKKGVPPTEDLQILHFETAFHGRSGYTLSVTCTSDPRKYQYFPKFDWPRVHRPDCTGCLGCTNSCRRPADELEAIVAKEQASLSEIRTAFAERGDKIAAILIEPIQGEGGDNHFRPEFLRQLRALCDEHDALLIFDEVQCGMGLTGTWWAWQQLGVEPDIFAFGKKSQVCGIAANARLAEVESVFQVSSRINSTWGGNLVDMVRAEEVIRIIEDENLLENATKRGASLRDGFKKIAADTGKIHDVRGRGLMIAFTVADTKTRDRLAKSLYDEKVIMLGCGVNSMRTRPVLDFDGESAELALDKVRHCVKAL